MCTNKNSQWLDEESEVNVKYNFYLFLSLPYNEPISWAMELALNSDSMVFDVWFANALHHLEWLMDFKKKIYTRYDRRYLKYFWMKILR